MEGFNYPKKPESEYGFEEFKLTGKRIQELREALTSIGKTTSTDSEATDVDVDQIRVPKERSNSFIQEKKEELRQKIERYEVLKQRLAEESNPAE